MSGADEHDEPSAPAPGRPPAAGKPPVDEDAMDLGDLDALGVDGMVAELRKGDDAPVDAPARRVRKGRTPFLSVLVAGAGIYLLTTMFSDFRYWLRSREPEELGQAADIAIAGRMPPGLHDHYVRISGTPDVRHAARMTTRAGYVGYLRITEGGGSLFAAIPRGKDEPVRDEFEGTFEGRMLRLDRDAGADWIEQYLRDENIVRTVDADVAALVAAIGGRGDRRPFASAEGKVEVGVGERVRVVVHPPDARVQLGLSSFPKAEDAERRVAALGYPWVSAGKGKAFHSFVVRIPEAERDAALAGLLEGIEVPAANTDPKRGAVVLPGTVAFSAALGDYAVEGDALSLPRTGESGPALYDVVGTSLQARPDVEGRIVVPRDWISVVRIEQPIALDREGYLVVVGDTPDKHWMAGAAWLVLAALVGLNLVSLGAYLRGRLAR